LEAIVDEMMLRPPKSEALRALYWRSEILQAMYWLRGEGFADGGVEPSELGRFLGADADDGIGYLDTLVADGYLEVANGRYQLSETGVKEGGMEFISAFEELTKPTHGDCSPDCWCKTSSEEAAACAAERAEHQHSHEHSH
jgi:hypothetical protein